MARGGYSFNFRYAVSTVGHLDATESVSGGAGVRSRATTIIGGGGGRTIRRACNTIAARAFTINKKRVGASLTWRYYCKYRVRQRARSLDGLFFYTYIVPFYRRNDRHRGHETRRIRYANVVPGERNGIYRGREHLTAVVDDRFIVTDVVKPPPPGRFD